MNNLPKIGVPLLIILTFGLLVIAKSFVTIAAEHSDLRRDGLERIVLKAQRLKTLQVQHALGQGFQVVVVQPKPPEGGQLAELIRELLQLGGG